jgi:uncharacterized phiE125 gp8 family phage protein
MIPILMAGPAVEPLSLEEARFWLRLEASEEDALVQSLIKAARCAVEEATRMALIAQKWRLRLDGWPADRLIHLPLAPIMSLDSVRIISAAGVGIGVDLSHFHVEMSRAPKIFVTGSPPLPGRLREGIEIDLTAGYGTSGANVPASLLAAMRLLIAHWYERRGVLRALSNRPAH